MRPTAVVFTAVFLVVAATSTLADESRLRAVAQSAGGIITENDLALLREQDPINPRRTVNPTVIAEVERFVIHRELSNRAGERAEPFTTDCTDRVAIRTTVLEAEALKTAVSKASEPAPQEVLKEYNATVNRYRRPQRWRLFNIFLRFPNEATVEQRVEIRARATKLRNRAIGGADFSKLARVESDSPTAIRGGRIGNIAASSFPPEVAAVVEKLEAGDTSKVIETDDGFTILRCTEVLPEEIVPLQKVRALIAGDLKRRVFDAEWERIGQEVRANVEAVETTTGGILIKEGDQATMIGTGAFRWWAEQRGLGTPDQHAEAIHELALTFGLAGETERRGLTDDQDFIEKLSWENEKTAAECVLAHEIKARLSAPTGEQVRTFYEAHGSELIDPKRRDLEILRTTLSPGVPADIYRQFARAADAVKSGKTDLQTVAEELAGEGTKAEFQRFEAIPPMGVQLFGRSIGTAVIALEVGGVSEPIQEGQDLLVVKVEKVTPQRQLSFEEAEPLIRRRLEMQQRRELRRAIEAEIVAEQEIRLMTDPEGGVD